MCKESKSALRQEWKKIRAEVKNPAEKSQAICEHLLRHKALLGAKTVFLYLSFGTEVETFSLAEELLAMGKQIAVPVCERETHTMQGVALSDMVALKRGAYGMLEPTVTETVFAKEEIDVILVPALAFDKDGFRLGYGGGYYDRYLEDYKGVTIGLCFEDCLTEKLPRGVYDKRVDMVVTECGIKERKRYG